MSTASKYLIALAVAVVLFVAFVWAFVLPANSSSPTIRQRNAVDHISYSNTAYEKAKAPKVLVCKYVGKPGVHERLKGGKNPIEVSANSLPGYNGGTPKPGDEFADAQERSVVVADGTTTCPAPIVPFKVTVRMTGEGIVRARFHDPSDSKVRAQLALIDCRTPRRITAKFLVQIGADGGSFGPYTSHRGPVLRVVSEGDVLAKVRAANAC